MIPIQEIDKLAKDLKKITNKKEWTGEETGIVLVSRAIENYIKKNYEQYQDYSFFNFDMETYTENYKKIGNQLLRENNENGSYLAGYIKINYFLYANYSYTVANEEIIKARYLYFFDKLKLAFGMEQVSNMQKEETEKDKSYYEQALKPLSITAIKDKTKKIKETIEDLEDALYWLKGYKTLLNIISKIYKLDLLFLMYKEIDLFVEDTYKRLQIYNNEIEVFKKYIIDYSKDKTNKINILENAYKKINFTYEIPKGKIKKAKEIMKSGNDKTAVNFYCFNNEILLDLLCDRSENE